MEWKLQNLSCIIITKVGKMFDLAKAIVADSFRGGAQKNPLFPSQVTMD